MKNERIIDWNLGIVCLFIMDTLFLTPTLSLAVYYSLLYWLNLTELDSGIRLFDTESLTRIAHIDRPTGARPSLYPTLSSLRPNLHFETSNYILVAWGDCLMGLSIIDHSNQRSTAASSADGQEESPTSDSHVPSSQRSLQQQQQPTVRRRTVECAMAWELDCVASGMHFPIYSILVMPWLDDCLSHTTL